MAFNAGKLTSLAVSVYLPPDGAKVYKSKPNSTSHRISVALEAITYFVMLVALSGPLAGQKTKVAKPSASFLTHPFNPDQEHVTPLFLGHSVASVFADLIGKEGAFQKSEFESEDTFEKRMDRYATLPLERISLGYIG